MFKQVKSSTCSGFVALFVKVQVGFLLNEAVDFYLDYSLAIQYISKSITCEYKNFFVCINDRQRQQDFYFQYLYNRFYLLC